MPVSKKRNRHTTQRIRRTRERHEIQTRAHYRAEHRERCLREALDRAIESTRLDEVAEAIREVGQLTGDDFWASSTVHDLEPDVQLASQPGWKRMGYVEDLYAERWIYSPSIPECWDESSSNEPTEVLWDGQEFRVTPATGPGHTPRKTVCYTNALHFYMALNEIEAW